MSQDLSTPRILLLCPLAAFFFDGAGATVRQAFSASLPGIDVPAMLAELDKADKAIRRCFPRYSTTNDFAYGRCAGAINAYKRTVTGHIASLTGGGASGWAALPAYAEGAAQAIANAPWFENSSWREEVAQRVATALGKGATSGKVDTETAVRITRTLGSLPRPFSLFRF